MTNILTASFNTRKWSIGRLDRRITAAIAERLGLGGKSGNYKKYRLDPDRPSWRAICANMEAFRKFHYAITIPWKHGAALLNPLALDEYEERFRFHKAEHDRLVAEFFADLEDAKAAVKGKLTDTETGDCWFLESDYDDLTPAAFDFDCTIEPMIHDADFDRFANLIGEEKAKELADKLNAENQRAFQASCDSVAQRLLDALRKTSDKLNNANRLHDCVMDSLQELTDLLPVLNITDDPEIEKTRKSLAALFRKHSAITVKSESGRKDCAAKVDEILARFGK